jgi:hypothetical protein
LLPPDDVMMRAGLVASFTFVNGQAQIEYHENVTEAHGSRVGPVVAPEEAAQRIAAASR